jgi:hypothetical protein
MVGALKAKDFAGTAANRRAEDRRPGALAIDILPCRAQKDWKFIKCEVVDCSLHGLGIVSPEPMDVGQQFLAKLHLPKGVRLLVYTVQNCAKMGTSSHRIGSHFSGFAAQELDEDLRTVLEALAAD